MSRIAKRFLIGKLPVWTGLIVFSVVAGWAAQSPASAFANDYEDNIGLYCDQDTVVEGQTYQLHVHRIRGSGLPHETMKVFWTTLSGTATEADYSSLLDDPQTSNDFQTKIGRMGRTFDTTEDQYTEETERFSIVATNGSRSVYPPQAYDCVMEILDDDGPGAVETRIDTVPVGYDRSRDQRDFDPDQGRYTLGEVIRVNLRFTEEVVVQGGGVTIGLLVGDEDADEANREATYASGSGSDTLTFEYRVGPEDIDFDGIAIPDGEFGGDGHVRTAEGRRATNTLYRGVAEDPEQKVLGITHVTDVDIVSNPAHGYTYHRDEKIEVQIQFSREVQVNGSVSLQLEVGEGVPSLELAPYRSGSGTDTLVFEYAVNAVDRDASGITVVGGGVDESGQPVGLVGSGSIVSLHDGEQFPTYNVYYPLTIQGSHKVDGRAYIKRVAITSEPVEGNQYVVDDEILVSLTFDQTVSILPRPAIAIKVGGSEVLAHYHRGSFSKTLVFRYVVDEDDVDHDGISVPMQNGFSGSGNVTEGDTTFGVNEHIPSLPHQPAHRVNGSLPAIVGNRISSTPENGDTYHLGEVIEFSLRFDGEVDVDGQPSIKIRLDGTEDTDRDAMYGGGSGTNTLMFGYTVQAADLDADGVALVARDAVGFEGDAKVYQAGTENEVSGHIPGFHSKANHKVDGRPLVTSTAPTSTPSSGGVYRAGETITVALTFERPVLVEGTPSIALLVGEHLAETTYRSGSGSNTVVFGYDVGIHDRDADGFSLPERIPDSFGSAGIYSAGGEIELDVGYTGFVGQEGQAVAGQVYIQSILVGSDPGVDRTYEQGDTIDVWLRFDDPVTVTGAPQLSLDIGDSVVLVGFASLGSLSDDGSTLSASQESGDVMVFSYTIEEGDIDSDGITIPRNGLSLHGGTILDNRDNEPDLLYQAATFASHRVGVVPPTFVSARTTNEGDEVILTFSENVHVRPDLRTVGRFTGVDTTTYPRALIDVLIDGHRAHTHDAEISGTELTLTMDSAIRSGQEVKVAFDDVFARDLPGLLVDADGNPLEHFGPQHVANNSTLVNDGGEHWPALSAYSLTIAEGGTATYTVALGSQPDQEVTVSLSISPSSGLTASPSSLTFTPDNWAGRQTVELTAEADDDALNGWHEIIHTADVAGFIVGHLKVLTEDE